LPTLDRMPSHEPDPATRARHAAWRAARRVLAIRIDNLGDLLMTTPALAALREGLPGAQLVLLASPSGAALAPHLPMLDAIWPCAVPWVRGEQRPVADDHALLARIAEARFDAAVIFTVCTQSALPAALFCRLAGIPRVLAHSRENPYALVSDWVPEPDHVGGAAAAGRAPPRHEVQRQLDLVAHAGFTCSDARLRFALRDADRQALAQRLAAAALAPGRRYAVVHPGASAPSRRWPAERFGAAAAQLAGASGLSIVIAGDAGDRAHVDVAQAACRAGGVEPVVLGGGLTLGELAALIDGAAVLVANNSGPAHLAAALGTPVVDLYALTNPQHTPWQVAHAVLNRDVPCRDCLKSQCPHSHHACLTGVPAEEAASAALALLAGARPGPRPWHGRDGPTGPAEPAEPAATAA
jgi:ADP-heptose:LPS heptosyltransferase